MTTLYFAPGTCARVSLIALEETGHPFETRVVAFMRGDHRAPDFLAHNPAGKVPVLIAEGVAMAQNIAILTYLARRFPEARLLPVATDNESATALLSRLAWFSADLHPIVTRIRMPQLICDQASGHSAGSRVGLRSNEIPAHRTGTLAAAAALGPGKRVVSTRWLPLLGVVPDYRRGIRRRAIPGDRCARAADGGSSRSAAGVAARGAPRRLNLNPRASRCSCPPSEPRDEPPLRRPVDLPRKRRDHRSALHATEDRIRGASGHDEQKPGTSFPISRH